MIKNSFIITLTFFSIIGLLALTPLPQTNSAPLAPMITPIKALTCATVTPEPLWVDPVKSPTDAFTQVVTVWIGHGECVTVSTKSGTFTSLGDFDADKNPALVTIDLLTNTLHFLSVTGTIRHISASDGCIYGGYNLYTWYDRYGKPLVIAQATRQKIYLPIILKTN
jgi:hypothetical protein